MANGNQKIDPDILADLEAQYQNDQIPENVRADLDEQHRIRQGDYPVDTAAGIFQSGVGATETLGSMIWNFAMAVPSTVVGLGKAASIRGGDPGDAFVSGFYDTSEKLSYSNKTVKGKQYQAKIEDTYLTYVDEKWGDHVGKAVETGAISPAEGAYYRTSADALVMGLFMRAGAYARGAGAKTADFMAGRTRPAKPPGSDLVRVEGQKKLPAPEDLPLRIAAREAFERGNTPKDVAEVADGATDIQAAAEAISGLGEKPKISNIASRKQSGAVDMSVIAEGVSRALRPGYMAAKGAADVSHALARQVAFKHVTDIRKLPSPTAKMLADRIMPSQSSTIPLDPGFHELINVKTGEYATRIENILEPIRRHVANKNSLSSMRIVALPKVANDAIIRGLEGGKVNQKYQPAVDAMRAILDDTLSYQQEAGVSVAERPNYFPHIWNAKKIAKSEFGRDFGPFSRHLVNELGVPKEAVPGIIRNITHEEGFLDFAEDTGGRLHKNADWDDKTFSAWSRAQRVGGGSASPAHVKQRVLETDFNKSGDWLVNDLESVLTNYIHRATLKAEYTRLTGRGEVKLNQAVRQIIEEVEIAESNSKTVKASTPGQIAQEIYDVFDAIQHRYHPIRSPAVRGLVKFVSGWEVMAHLGLVALAQLPETMIPAVKYRVATATKAVPGAPVPLKSYAVGMMEAVHNAASSASTLLTGKRVIPKSSMRRHLEAIGVSKVSALESSTAQMMPTAGKLTSRFIRTVLMEAITDLQRSVAYDTITSMIRENARYLAKGLAQGKREKMYRQELVELGFDPQEVIDWYRAGMPKDHPIQQKMDIALVRGIDTTIIMPKAANAPRLYNDPRFQPFLIFTRFFTAFGNTVIKKVFRNMASDSVTNTRKLAAMSSVIASIAVAYYTQFLREDITGYEYREEDDPMRVIDAVDRAGWTAMFTRLYPLVAGEYRYSMGSKTVAGLFGPIGIDGAKLIEAIKGSNEQKARWMASMTPILNITPETEEELIEFYLELIEATEDAID